jgi:hypothetical protein
MDECDHVNLAVAVAAQQISAISVADAFLSTRVSQVLGCILSHMRNSGKQPALDGLMGNGRQ